jgi:hypothetical protein
MSDAFTDIAQSEKEKFDYLAARLTISTYIVTRAMKRPNGSLRNKYLELAYNETLKAIKTDVEDTVGVLDA